MPRPSVPSVVCSVVSGILVAAVANGGTVAVGYPLLQPGTVNPQTKNKGNFAGVGGDKLTINQAVLNCPTDFELTMGATTVTVTNRSGSTWPAGSPFRLQLNEAGSIVRFGNQQLFPGNSAAIVGPEDGGVVMMNLGAPAALSATAVAAVQAITGTAPINALINGANAVGGVAYMDVPRAVRVVSSAAGDTTQIATVYGTDAYGQAMRENIALNGTTVVPGKKAFFTVTRVSVSALMAGNLSVGSTDVLGLPAYLPFAGYVIKELQDGAAPTAGILVAGASVTPTATSADVRGTYTPNAATDGTKALQLVVLLINPTDIGGSQFNG